MRPSKSYFQASVVFSLVILLFSCGDEPMADMQTVLQENHELKAQVRAQDSIVTRLSLGAKFVDAYLDSLERLEQSVKGDLAGNQHDSVIIGKVRAITSLVSLNRSIIEDLKRSLGEDNMAARLLLDHVLKLDNKVKAQELRIALLNKDLDELGNDLRSVLGEYAELETQYRLQTEGLSKYRSKVQNLETELTMKDAIILDREQRLYTAYYYFGDKRELLAKGILKKSNLFTMGVDENIKFEDLNRVDIRSFNELVIPTSSIEVMSDHPQGSYMILFVDGMSKLVVKDPTKFWSITRTLIIQTLS